MRQYMGRNIVQLVLLTAVFCSFAFSEAGAAGKLNITSADKGSVGRLAVDWGTDQPFSTEIEEGFLYIRFTEVMEDADFTSAAKTLEAYIGPGEILEGRQSVRFPMKGDFSLSSRQEGTKIIVELTKPAAGTTNAVVKLRSGEHGDFSRLVFDWPEKAVGHSSVMSGNNLVITFDKAAKIDLGGINEAPPKQVEHIADEARDGKTVVTIALAPGSDSSSFINEKSIVYDIRAGKPVPQLAKKPVLEPAKPNPVEAKAVESPVMATKVETPVSKVEKVEKGAEAPLKPAAASVPDQKARPATEPLPHKAVADPVPSPKSAELAEELPIVSDIKETVATIKSPLARDETGAHGFALVAPSSTSAVAAIGPTIILDPEAAGEENSTAEAETAALPPVQEMDKHGETIDTLAESAEPVAVQPAPENRLAIEIANLKDGFRLIFPWHKPAAMAMFEEDGAYWVVFDQPAVADFSNLTGPYKFLVSSASQQDNDSGTLLRFNFREGYIPKVNKVKNEWHIDFQIGTTPVLENAITVQSQTVSSSGLRLYIPAVNNGHEIRFTDHKAGEELVVMPLNVSGWGLKSPKFYNGISLLASVQGIALKTKDATLQIDREQNGVSVVAISTQFMPDVAKKKDVPKMDGEGLHQTPDFKTAHFVKLGEWRQVSPVLFTKRKHELQQRVFAAPPQEKRAALMTLAKFFVGHRFFADATGVLGQIHARYPDFEKDREYRLLMGLAGLGLHHLDKAGSYLNDADFDGDIEVAPWRGAVAAASGDWVKAAQELNFSAPAFAVYPEETKTRFELLRAQAALKNIDVNLAKSLLAEIKAPTPSEQASQKAYLEGILDFQLSDFPAATAKFSEVIKSGDRPVAERARFQKINVDLISKGITPEEAIEELEKLDFGWRGDDLEVDIQKRLGDLYVATGQIGNGIESYKRIVTHFPASSYSRDLGKKMNDLFAELFLEGGADKLPPIKALALYYQYRELTPVGDKGDKMIRNLADRLARVDLLEQSAQLLEHQVNFRLKGLERTNAGTKLAVIQLWNNKPEESLKVLYKTKWRHLPPEARRERLHIETRAQADLQHYKEALNLIADDTSSEADVLRAEIYWKSKNWPQAIPAIEHLIGNGRSTVAEDLDRLDRQRIMQLAVARNLANDKNGIRKMRNIYRGKMVGTADLAAFDLITEDNDPSAAEFRKRATIIAEVSQLESFMAGYREKLENGQFWASY